MCPMWPKNLKRRSIIMLESTGTLTHLSFVGLRTKMDCQLCYARQSGSTSRSASGRRSGVMPSDNVVATAVRRLKLDRDNGDSDGMLAGPTTRLQWCQQWLHRESAKRRSSEPNTVRCGFCIFATNITCFFATEAAGVVKIPTSVCCGMHCNDIKMMQICQRSRHCEVWSLCICRICEQCESKNSLTAVKKVCII